MYLTATVTITQCNPTNTECPLYTPTPTPTTSSSSIFTPTPTPSTSTTPSSSSSSFSSYSYAVNTTTSIHYPVANSTAHGGSTGHPTGSIPATYPGLTTTSVPTYGSSPSASATPPTAAANSLGARSGLILAAMGLGAVLLA
ncbi:hypothetical protein NUW58_g10252 [Xylaria curta]|uniref:Uncharacterized protein n=1 Tax=Xylaria curta TaxID=42375 RepID=A0ACC1MMX3_9PEZI|nr:hypothetical protein NUW58_g10252 [Xylaria curta]